MRSKDQDMNVNKFLPFAFIYFFINSLALPFGLTYTTLLAPLLYVWIMLIRKKEVLLPFIAILLPFCIMHIAVSGVEERPYMLSLLNLCMVYIFCQAVYTFLLVCNDIDKIFCAILVVNFIACLIAIPLFYTSYNYVLWDEQDITEGVGTLRRLKLLTYEPSYYAFLFTPLFFYFSLQYLFRLNTIKGWWLLPMILLPYLLSFSIGVMAVIFLAYFLTMVIYFNRLASRKRIFNALVNTGILLVTGMLVLVIFFRTNPIFIRIGNIFKGKDTSGKGRTVDSFVLAGKMLEQKNEYWGIGLGQIKILGEEVIRDYYLYNKDFIATIPNAAAETLAIFGWVGLFLRIAIELFFFFYTRVWTNYYRLLLFLFAFIYQFTGSFITNVAEYVIWILAFTNVFQQFDVKPKQNRIKENLPVKV